MRRHFSILVFILFAIPASAQYVPYNSQAFQFMPLYNPAFSGVESFHDLKVSYRQQWSGFGSEAPKYMNLSYTMRLKQPLDLTFNSMRSSHTATLAPLNYPRSKTLIHGMGLNVFNETFGETNRTGGGISYSFNSSISKHLRLAIGIGAVYENQKVGTGIILQDPTEGYPNIPKTTLSARTGLLIYGRSFYFGISYLPVFYSVTPTPEDPFYKASAQFGLSLQLSPEFVLKPGVLALLQADNKFQIDYSIKTTIRQRVLIGVSYRDIKSAVALVGFEISDVLTASYSYEFSTGGLKQFSGPSHELVLAVRINNFKRHSQYTW